jgi:glycine cleavage system regulatory protein
MKESVVLTVISEDHPGIVETLSQTLAGHGGNWVESNMLSMAGKFAGILLVDVPGNQMEGLIADLAELESAGMQIVAEPCGRVVKPEGAHQFYLELVGQDRPGIVRDITQILAKHHINVDELDTQCRNASMSNEILFIAQAHLSVPAEASVDALRDELEDLANELMVDIKLKE